MLNILNCIKDSITNMHTHPCIHVKRKKYRTSGFFRVGEFWRKWRLECVLNIHWVLFSLFQGLSMKMYNRVYFSLCLFLAVSGRSLTQRKLNPCEKFTTYGIMRQLTRVGYIYCINAMPFFPSWVTCDVLVPFYVHDNEYCVVFDRIDA